MYGVLQFLERFNAIDLLTLGDSVDGYGVGDLHYGVEDGGDQPGEEGDYHRKAEWIMDTNTSNATQ